MGEMAAADVGGCKSSRPALAGSVWWPYCLARSVVALVISAAAAVIMVKAVFLILHPNKFQLKISGNLLVEQWEDGDGDGDGNDFICRFNLQAEKHDDRAFMYYKNVTVRLIDRHVTIMEFNLTEAITLMQGQVQDYYLSEEYVGRLDPRYFDKLFPAGGTTKQPRSIGDSTVELDGLLTNGVQTYRASYSCEPVTIVSDTSLLTPPSGNDAARCIPALF